jgi:hypothetical protein
MFFFSVNPFRLSKKSDLLVCVCRQEFQADEKHISRTFHFRRECEEQSFFSVVEQIGQKRRPELIETMSIIASVL